MEIAKKKIIYNGVGLPVCEKLEEIYTIDTPDYWTRLEHQFAGMAMQGILAHEGTEFRNYIPQEAMDIAHALVEKLKESK